MGRDVSTTKMEDTMRATGRTTKWTVLANCTTRVVKWPTKACGLKISSTDQERSTTIILWSCRVPSITQTSTFLRITGSIMKECYRRTPKRGGEGSNYRTDKFLRGIFMRIKYKVLGSFIIQKERPLKGCGVIPSCLRSLVVLDVNMSYCITLLTLL